jgi:ABC-type transporter Mla subunit MlaD
MRRDRGSIKTTNQILTVLKNISNVSMELLTTSKSLSHSSNDLKNNVINTSTAATQASSSVEEIYMTTLKTLEDLEVSKGTIVKSVTSVQDAQKSISDNIKAANQIEIIKRI